ncbi:MAG: Ni/Fe hydrogenase subunit alpha [Bryobacteraceae bacterium]
MNETIRIEHLARVEGHGGILVELEGNEVASVHFEILEGLRLMEGLVRGRGYQEVAPTLSRVCSICSAAHAVTSLRATEAAFGVEVSEQTRILRELLYLGGNIASHALHVFLLAAPDYLDMGGAPAMAERHPDVVMVGLRLKKLGNRIQTVIGGRAIHPVNAIVGGFGKLPEIEELIALRTEILQGVADCQSMLEFVAALPPANLCQSRTTFAWLASGNGPTYSAGEAIHVRSANQLQSIPIAEYRKLSNEESVTHSHARHSTFGGAPFMVGALARMMEQRPAGERAAAAMEKIGLKLPSDKPEDNNKAQAVELVMDMERALEIVERFIHNGFQPESRPSIHPGRGTGTAGSEAPRGLLFHSYTYDERGRIESADIVTPTALNAASIEEHMRETVMQNPGTPVPLLTKKLEMLVRAYDPCISCSVHLMQRRNGV